MVIHAQSYALDNQEARQRWEYLWKSSPQRSAFTSLSYADCAAAAFGLRARLVLVGSGATDEAGAITLHSRARRATPPPFTQYFGPVLRQPSDETLVHGRRSPLELTLAALEAEYRYMLFLTRLEDPRPAQWRRWHVAPSFTYILSPAEGRAAWSASTRRTYKKYDGVCDFTEDDGAAPQIVRCCQESYVRHRRKLPAPNNNLVRLVESLQERGMVRLFTLRRAGRLEGGLALLHDGQMAHYWIAGSTPGPAMTVLVGRTLRTLRSSGISAFDFVGANTPTIAEFKRRFGARLSMYYRLEFGRTILRR